MGVVAEESKIDSFDLSVRIKVLAEDLVRVEISDKSGDRYGGGVRQMLTHVPTMDSVPEAIARDWPSIQRTIKHAAAVRELEGKESKDEF